MAVDGAYVDSSAIVKLIAAEPESAALRTTLTGRAFVATSELALVEVPRAVQRRRARLNRREQRALPNGLEATIDALDPVPLDTSLLRSAGELPGGRLRSLDAVHVVSALTLGDGLDTFVAYDVPQPEAPEAHGLLVAAPA